MGKILIGTASWTDKSLITSGRFYPPKCNSPEERLRYYASQFPLFEVDSHEVPTGVNPLGAKGVGEAGTVGALPALLNAVNDALAPLGVRHLDMPVTPERVWQAMRASGG